MAEWLANKYDIFYSLNQLVLSDVEAECAATAVVGAPTIIPGHLRSLLLSTARSIFSVN
jgi:hypothetical protein